MGLRSALPRLTFTEYSPEVPLSENDLELYESLRFTAKSFSRTLLPFIGNSTPSAQVAYFKSQAEQLVSIETRNEKRFANIGNEILEFLNCEIHRYFQGTMNFSDLRLQLMSKVGFHYWDQLMNADPLGKYPAACASFLKRNELLTGRVFELGAGCGNLSRLIDSKSFEYIRSDLTLPLLNKNYGAQNIAYDFNKTSVLREIDLVTAANSLHCARDKRATLGYIYEMLKPGGWLVFAEGQNLVCEDEPWALNLLFALYDGWWDVGGFRQREDWLEDLSTAGFVECGFTRLAVGRYDFGGVFCARKPI